MTKKEEIIGELSEARRNIIQTAVELSPEQQNRNFLGVWSVKDLLAHLVGWGYTNVEGRKKRCKENCQSSGRIMIQNGRAIMRS